jgi:hypothetical protein
MGPGRQDGKGECDARTIAERHGRQRMNASRGDEAIAGGRHRDPAARSGRRDQSVGRGAFQPRDGREAYEGERGADFRT